MIIYAFSGHIMMSGGLRILRQHSMYFGGVNGMAWALILMYLILIAPVKGGLLLQAEEGRQEGAWGVMLWGVLIRGHVSVRRDGQGRLRLEGVGRRKKQAAGKKGKWGKWIRMLGGKAPRYLLRKGVRPERLEVYVGIAAGDAALTALLCGALQGLAGMFPRLRARFYPCFGGKSSIRLRCIVSARLGILLFACVAGGIQRLLADKKEAKPWNIPSDA